MISKGGEIKIETLEVAGIVPSLIGMRNPMNSWHRSDSCYHNIGYDRVAEVGSNDTELARKLIKAGSEHRKFARQIQVWANITMPRYIWQELDTYKFGTKNSCSTMHTLHKKEFTLDDFYFGDDPYMNTILHFRDNIIPLLNEYRDNYFESDLDYTWIIEMKRCLPENFLQMRTWNTNYEELYNIYNQRKSHRLKDEYRVLIEWIEELPYFKELFL